MIVRAAPSLPAARAARRAAAGTHPCWLASPGADDVGLRWEVVACDPVEVVAGADVAAVDAAWGRARARLGGFERRGQDLHGGRGVAGGRQGLHAGRGDRGRGVAGRRGAAGPPPGVPVGVGFLSYDLGRRFERIPSRAVDDHGWPELTFAFYDAVWRRTPDGRAEVLAADAPAARRLLDRLAVPAAEPDVRLGRLTPDAPDERYLAGVRRIREHLRAGDAYQVNLARRLAATVGAGDGGVATDGTGPGADAAGLALAAALRARAPAPHAFWMAFGPAPMAGGEHGRPQLVGNSPERFLAVHPGGAIETRPIKGTRPRGADAGADRAAAAELRASAKDRAEHVMIVDLERNDLGRVCRSGSVAVEGLLRLVSLPTVHHLVSTVRGQLRPGVDLPALLRATFPGGSVTGAPKIQAMHIIEALEPFRRGPYTGATGWLGAAGDLDLALAIRTATVRDGRLQLWVGGGIVIDSDPDAELAETEAKAAAFRGVVGHI